MPHPDRLAEWQWLISAVSRCRRTALGYFRSSRLRVKHKSDGSPVTQADRAVEVQLRRAIARRFPKDTLIGEEYGRSGASQKTFWTIDPIDGTRAFSRGLPTWCIMVGKVEKGKAVFGLCDFPALGTTLLVAPKVAAQERTGRVIKPLARVGKAINLKNSVIFHGGAGWWEQSPYQKGFRRLIKTCFLERAYGDCYGYLWAFRGYADAVIEYGVKIWDMVPLAALADATGRVLIDVAGKPSWTGPDTIMAHPDFARQVAATLRKKT